MTQVGQRLATVSPRLPTELRGDIYEITQHIKDYILELYSKNVTVSLEPSEL